MEFPRPKVLFSRCLGFEICRYNGEEKRDAFVEQLLAFVEPIAVCPEVEIGMPIPRMPIHQAYIKGKIRLLQKSTGDDLTERMETFSTERIAALPEIEGAVLKARSPSCGVSGAKIDNAPKEMKKRGMFARELEAQRPWIALEDESRLFNYRIREHWLTKLFTLSRFREIRDDGDAKALTRFQEAHKYLLMAYSPALQKKLGQIAANHEKRLPSEQFSLYELELHAALTKMPSKGRLINAFEHMGGYFKKTASEAERSFFAETLEMYREGRIPMSSVVVLIHGWALRDRNVYLLGQTLLHPFPVELMELKDSGRVLEL